MRCEDITRDQADAITKKIGPMLSLNVVVRGENVMHELSVEVHFLSCGDVVGKVQPEGNPLKLPLAAGIQQK